MRPLRCHSEQPHGGESGHGCLLLHQMMLMVKPLETLVIGGVYGVRPFIFLLNSWNLIILALDDHFLILMVKESVLFLLSSNL